MKITLNQNAERELLELREAMGNHSLQHTINVLIRDAHNSKIIPSKEEIQHYANSPDQQQ